MAVPMKLFQMVLLALLLHLALASLGAQASIFDFMKAKPKGAEITATKSSGAESNNEVASANEQQTGHLDEVLNQPMGRQSHGLEAIRAAKLEQERLAVGPDRPTYPKRLTGLSLASAGKVQGRGRNQPSPEHKHNEDEEDEEDDEDDDEDDEGQSSHGKNARLSTMSKFIRTGAAKKNTATDVSLLPKLNYNNRLARLKNVGACAKGDKKCIKMMTTEFWGKKLGAAYKVTKKGILAGASAISELPKLVHDASESISAFLQLDVRGRLLALIEETNQAANFVRKEFSQFTLAWSPIMEKALNYLGDDKLDKIHWNSGDELDLRQDAMHSLVFGFEFINLLIVWRENLLTAHEAFKLWLEATKRDYDDKKFEVDNKDLLVMELRSVRDYILLMAWDTITRDIFEPRTKLEHLMKVEDDRPKNYESEYFRDIIILQQMFTPTMEELNKQRDEVTNAVEDLDDVADYFIDFRKKVALGEANVDVSVPEELTDFLAKLKLQLKAPAQVYTKSFLIRLENMLAAQKAES